MKRKQRNKIESTMEQASSQMLRMQLIKQSLPFSKLSHERLEWLARQVEEIKLAHGEILFRQGEIGDKAYLICLGQVGIYIEAKNQKELMKGVKEVIELCLEINTSTFYNIISPIRPQIYAFQLVSI